MHDADDEGRGLVGADERSPSSGWLPAAVENDAYEGIRQGEEAAFRVVAQPLQPVLRRLTRIIVPPSVDPDSVIADAWAGALRSLQMFRWRTPFATWVAEITVAHARAHAVRESRERNPKVAAWGSSQPAPGPTDWSDLPWGARWEHAWAILPSALIALPLAQREVVHARDAEQWPSRRVCDVFGLPEVVYRRLLAEGRAQLHGVFSLLVTQSRSDGPDRAAQTEAVSRMLRESVHHLEEPLDPRLVAVFRSWRVARLRTWRRLGERLLHPTSRAF